MIGYFNQIIDVIRDHWQVMLAVFLVVRLFEAVFKRLFKRVFGIIAVPLSVIKKVTILDWVLIALLIASFAAIAYLAM